MIKINKKERITILFYLIAATIYYISSSIWGMSNNFRYMGMLAAIVQGVISILYKYRNKGLKYVKGKNLIWILFLYFYLIVTSIIRVRSNGGILSARVWVQTGYILIPALYAFCLINLLSLDTILTLVKYTFVLGAVLYIIKTGPANFFSLANWKSFTFSNPDADSVFESSTFTLLFIVAFLYFYYFILKQKNENKLFFWLSFCFAILGWKRLGVIFVICMVLILPILKIKKNILRWIPLLTGIGFGIVTVYYTRFMQGTFNPLNLNVYQFSTGRDYILSL